MCTASVRACDDDCSLVLVGVVLTVVLSSDESESGESSPRRRPAALHLKVGVVEAAAQQKAPNRDTVTQEDATKSQVDGDDPGDPGS